MKSLEMFDPSETRANKAVDPVFANFRSHFIIITFFSVGSKRNKRICMLNHEEAFSTPGLVSHSLIKTIFHSMPHTYSVLNMGYRMTAVPVLRHLTQLGKH